MNTSLPNWCLPLLPSDAKALLAFCLITILLFSATPLIAQNEAMPGLLAFRAAKLGDDAQLEWQMKEAFVKYDFVVQRSVDDVDFYAIGVVNAGGSMKSHDTYGFSDENVAVHDCETLYYRLVQIGDKGTNYQSKSIGLSQYETEGIIVDNFPNPEKPGVMNIAYLARGEGELLIQIVDDDGKSVYFSDLPVGQGFLVKEVAVSRFPAGTYHIRLFDDRYAVTKEMVVWSDRIFDFAHLRHL